MTIDYTAWRPDYSVSICVPVHNVSERLLRRCLSVHTASRPEDQVMVVLDGPSAVKHIELVKAALPRVEMIIHDRSEETVVNSARERREKQNSLSRRSDSRHALR